MSARPRTAEATLLRGSAGGPAALDLAVAHALLQRVAAGANPDVVRVYAPSPTLAFGRLDALRPGFGRAVEAASRRGFAPAIRVAGGHAAAYDEGCVVVDEIAFDADALAGMQGRFEEGGARIADVLRVLGVDARVGEVPREYCPGAFSVNARGRVKLAGSAQRVVRNAWLSSTVIVVTGATAIRDVLVDVYDELAMPLDPATVAAVEDEVDGASAGGVADLVVDAQARHRSLVTGTLDPAVVDHARRLLDRHAVPPPSAAR